MISFKLFETIRSKHRDLNTRGFIHPDRVKQINQLRYSTYKFHEKDTGREFYGEPMKVTNKEVHVTEYPHKKSPINHVFKINTQ